MKAVRKNAGTREKEIRLAVFRIERGRSRTEAKRLTISAVAREAGVSSSLIHNHYPAVAEEIRAKQGASSRQKLDQKGSLLGAEKERTRELRAELAELKMQIAKLATNNEMLEMENQILAAKCGDRKVAPFPPRSGFSG